MVEEISSAQKFMEKDHKQMKRLELSDKNLIYEDATTLILYQRPNNSSEKAELFLVNDWVGVSFWLSAVALQALRDWCDGRLKELDK